MLLLLDAQKSSKVFPDSAFLILTFSFLKSFVPSKLSSLMTHPCHMHGSIFVDVSSLNGMLAPLCQSQCTAVFASIFVPLLSSIDSPVPQNSHPLTLATPMYEVASVQVVWNPCSDNWSFIPENFISENFLIKLEVGEGVFHSPSVWLCQIASPVFSPAILRSGWRVSAAAPVYLGHVHLNPKLSLAAFLPSTSHPCHWI